MRARRTARLALRVMAVAAVGMAMFAAAPPATASPKAEPTAPSTATFAQDPSSGAQTYGVIWI